MNRTRMYEFGAVAVLAFMVGLGVGTGGVVLLEILMIMSTLGLAGFCFCYLVVRFTAHKDEAERIRRDAAENERTRDSRS